MYQKKGFLKVHVPDISIAAIFKSGRMNGQEKIYNSWLTKNLQNCLPLQIYTNYFYDYYRILTVFNNIVFTLAHYEGLWRGARRSRQIATSGPFQLQDFRTFGLSDFRTPPHFLIMTILS